MMFRHLLLLCCLTLLDIGVLAIQSLKGNDYNDFPPTPIQYFEVHPPVFAYVTSNGNKSLGFMTDCKNSEKGNEDCLLPEPECTQVILRHSFSNSYGSPAVIKYIPRCADLKFGASYTAGSERFSKIILRLDAQIKGRQFDRYGAVWLDGVELWRFTSAEPIQDGIWWTAHVDVTKYRALFSPNRRSADGSRILVMALDNLVNDIYTGSFNITLTLDFYEFESYPKQVNTLVDDVEVQHSFKVASNNENELMEPKWDWPWNPPSDKPGNKLPASNLRRLDLIHLSASQDSYGWFKISTDNFNNAYYTLSDADYTKLLSEPFLETGLNILVSPHGEDEFYYAEANPFREIRVHFDDLLVGITYPYPVVYTGGMNPLLWRPVASTGAYNIEPYYLDLTPFSQLLRDKKVSKIRFEVCSGTENGSCIPPKSFWLIDGILLIRRFDLDDANKKNDIPNSDIENIFIEQIGDINGKIEGSIVEKFQELDYKAYNKFSVNSIFNVTVELKSGAKNSISYNSFTGGNLYYSNSLSVVSKKGNQDEGDPQDADKFEQVLDCKHFKGINIVSDDYNANLSIPDHFPEPHASTYVLKDTFYGTIIATPLPTESSNIKSNLQHESLNPRSSKFVSLDEERIPLLLNTWIEHNTTKEQQSDGCPSPVADEFGIDAGLLAGGKDYSECTFIVSVKQTDVINQSSQGSFIIYVRKDTLAKNEMPLFGNSRHFYSDAKASVEDSNAIVQTSNTSFSRTWSSEYVNGCWIRIVRSLLGVVATDEERICK